MELKDKVVLVTGASEGIGLATARAAAAAGAKVVLAARSTDKLSQLAEELQQAGYAALVVTTDMRNQADVTRLIETTVQHFGRVDVLINNAGQAVAGTIADLDLDAYRQVIELNVFGPVYAMQASVPHLRAQGGGLIVNVSSMVSKMSIPGLGGYASTKSALNMLSDTARGELARDNIRVITVYPRMTATDFGRNSIGNRQVRQQQRGNAAPEMVIDSAEHVAGKILEAIEKEPAEQFMDS
jgi:short-subunit dehydrogenase